jgi:low affinity Fe/Cu permease
VGTARRPLRQENGGTRFKFLTRGTLNAAVALTRRTKVKAGFAMAQTKTRPQVVAAHRDGGQTFEKSVKGASACAAAPASSWNDTFSKVACAIAHWMGKPVSFLVAIALVLVWALSGPMFGFSDTWQLVINTSTTIITFLMVFLIQNTQNRDTMALQLKLSELILCINEAENRFAGAEDMTEDQLEVLHEELKRRADNTLGALEQRRESRTKKAS